jgi:hypothetical protein
MLGMTEAGPWGCRCAIPFSGQGRPRARVRQEPRQELRHRLRRELGLARRLGPNPEVEHDEPPLVERRIHHRPRFRPRANHHAHFHHAVEGLRRHLALPD